MPARVRVYLAAPAGADLDRTLPWLPEAAAAVWGRGVPDEPAVSVGALHSRWDARFPPGMTLLGSLTDGQAIAVIRLRAVPGEVLVIDALAVQRDQRNRGYGHELVIAAETGYGTGMRSAAAGVPRMNGLALYFWLRAGYRPCFPDPSLTGAKLGTDRMWMVRNLL